MCMRGVDRKITYRLSINQAVTVNLPHMHEESYMHLLNMHEACTEKKMASAEYASGGHRRKLASAAYE